MKSGHRIDVNGIALYAYHGCMEEESRIGSDYEVNLSVWADLSISAKTDSLQDTVDYVSLNNIVKEEMGVRAKLLETVVQRIVDRVFEAHLMVFRVSVALSKLAPPINGDVARVTVLFDKKREKRKKIKTKKS